MERQQHLHYRPKNFAHDLLRWHSQHGRKNLPWTQTKDPYVIWISEIMLQQTQVSTVIPYFEKFILNYPDVAALADAELDEVLSLWQGLGYYARARNLHKASKMVVSNFEGRFPPSVDGLMKLPGIGKSTAGAICALAFNQSEPILDGNAKRVYARIFEVKGDSDNARTKTLWSLARKLTPKSNCARYTQAIMDLGATICLPRRPLCDQCPMTRLCRARQSNSQEIYPIRKETRSSTRRSVTMMIVRDFNGKILLERRPAEGIWGGLWSFPECHQNESNLVDWFLQRYGVAISLEQTWPSFDHQFTHLRLTITPQLSVVTSIPGGLCDHLKFMSIETALQVGTPKPVSDMLKRIKSELELTNSTDIKLVFVQ